MNNLIRKKRDGFGFAAEDTILAGEDWSAWLDNLGGGGGDWWGGSEVFSDNDWYSFGYDTFVASGILTPDQFDAAFGYDPSLRGYAWQDGAWHNPQTGGYIVPTLVSGGDSHWWDFITQPGPSASDVQSTLDWWATLNGGRDANMGAPMVYGSNLPGYCPQGYYHPLNDPFACVPFPTDPAQRQQAQRQAQQQQQQARQQQAGFPKPQNQNCPSGYQPVKGPDGKIYCVLPNRNVPGSQGIPGWLLLALIALGVIVLVRK